MEALGGDDKTDHQEGQLHVPLQSIRSASSLARQVARELEIEARDALISRMRKTMKDAGIPMDLFEAEDATPQGHDQLHELKLNACGNGCTTRQAEMEEQIRIHETQIARMQRTLQSIVLLKDDHLVDKDENEGINLKAKGVSLKNNLAMETIGKKRKLECTPEFTKKKGRHLHKGGSKTKGDFCKKCYSTHRGPCSIATMSCKRCGKMGHKFGNCRSALRVCYNCREMGHISSKCPNPKVEAGGKRDDSKKRKVRASNK